MLKYVLDYVIFQSEGDIPITPPLPPPPPFTCIPGVLVFWECWCSANEQKVKQVESSIAAVRDAASTTQVFTMRGRTINRQVNPRFSS